MTQGNGKLARMQVFAVLKAMEKPPHLTLHQWQQIMDVLWAIARHYPTACPGQERLAMKARMSVRSCRRYTTMAVELGLLTVWYDAGVRSRGSKSSTSRYLINEQHVEPMELTAHAANLAGAHAANLACKVVGDTHVSPTTTNKHPSGGKSSTSHPREVRAETARTTVTEMDEKSREGRGLPLRHGDEGFEFEGGDRRIDVPPPSKRHLGPAGRMTKYFHDQWAAMVEGRPEFNDTRPWESRMATAGYLNKVFFKPVSGKTYTEAEVKAYIDRFIEGVRTGYTIIKRGQSAFMRFTGWWGRDTGTADSIFNESVDKYLR